MLLPFLSRFRMIYSAIFAIANTAAMMMTMSAEHGTSI